LVVKRSRAAGRPLGTLTPAWNRLLETLRAVRSVLNEPGVLVGGLEVPNLLEIDARSSLVVSEACVLFGI